MALVGETGPGRDRRQRESRRADENPGVFDPLEANVFADAAAPPAAEGMGEPGALDTEGVRHFGQRSRSGRPLFDHGLGLANQRRLRRSSRAGGAMRREEDLQDDALDPQAGELVIVCEFRDQTPRERRPDADARLGEADALRDAVEPRLFKLDVRDRRAGVGERGRVLLPRPLDNAVARALFASLASDPILDGAVEYNIHRRRRVRVTSVTNTRPSDTTGPE